MTEASVEKAPIVSFNITFRDRDHFNKVVKWLNANAGHGKESWTTNGKVLKHLNRGKTITRNIRIYNEEFDTSTSVFLTLI